MPSNAKSMKYSPIDGLKKLSLLLVDSDAASLRAGRNLFQPVFGNVFLAGNSAEAVAACERYRIDIVLTDVELDGSDGIDLAQVLKKNAPGTPVVLSCSLADTRTLARAINADIDGYLPKPINVRMASQTMEKIGLGLLEKRRYAYQDKLLEEYRRAVDASAIVSKTDRNGIITYVNDAFCTITGYSRDELIGSHHNIVRHPDTPGVFFADMWRTINNKEIWKGTLKNRKKDGSAYYVSATIVPITDEKDEIEEFLAIRQDVTELFEHRLMLEERVREEVERNIAERKRHEGERLKEAKFSAIGRMAAGITHEINTPLTYIRGNLEILLSDIERVEDETLKAYFHEDISTVMEGVDRIASIVESMREMASQGSGKLASYNLYATLVTALTMAYNRSKQVCPVRLQGVPFEIGMEKHKYPYRVCVDHQRIEQVWLIIVNNAIDVLKQVTEYDDRFLEISIEPRGEESIAVHFRDSGGGIDEGILDKLFEPFESTKREGGIGIGLNIARNIITMHKGHIEAHNEGNGAHFIVTLPVSCDEYEEALEQ